MPKSLPMPMVRSCTLLLAVTACWPQSMPRQEGAEPERLLLPGHRNRRASRSDSSSVRMSPAEARPFYRLSWAILHYVKPQYRPTDSLPFKQARQGVPSHAGEVDLTGHRQAAPPAKLYLNARRKREGCAPSRTGPLTLRMMRRFWSSRNFTRTCVTCTRTGQQC